MPFIKIPLAVSSFKAVAVASVKAVTVVKMPYIGMMGGSSVASVPPVIAVAAVIICTAHCAHYIYKYNKMNNNLKKIENNGEKITEVWKKDNYDMKDKIIKVRSKHNMPSTAICAIDTTYNIDFDELAEEFITEYINE
jgi:hypothetical protein